MDTEELRDIVVVELYSEETKKLLIYKAFYRKELCRSDFFSAMLSNNWRKRKRNPLVIHCSDLERDGYEGVLKMMEFTGKTAADRDREIIVDVKSALAILKVSSKVLFEHGITSTLTYLGSVPWTDVEKDGIAAVLEESQIKNELAQAVLDRIYAPRWPWPKVLLEDLLQNIIDGIAVDETKILLEDVAKQDMLSALPLAEWRDMMLMSLKELEKSLKTDNWREILPRLKILLDIVDITLEKAPCQVYKLDLASIGKLQMNNVWDDSRSPAPYPVLDEIIKLLNKWLLKGYLVLDIAERTEWLKQLMRMPTDGERMQTEEELVAIQALVRTLPLQNQYDFFKTERRSNPARFRILVPFLKTFASDAAKKP